jgi:hypothetical protein
VDRLFTGRLKLEEINHGFDVLNEDKTVRQVIVSDPSTSHSGPDSPAPFVRV